MNWRRLLTVVGFGLFVWFFAREWPHLRPALVSIQRISLPWIITLLLLEISYLCLNTLATQTSLRFFGQIFSWRQLVITGLESIYLNSVVPSIGLAGIAPLWERADEQTHSKRKVVSGYIMSTSLTVLTIALLWIALTVESWYRVGLFAIIIGSILFARRLKERPKLAADAFIWAWLANTCQAIMLFCLFRAMHYHISVTSCLFVYAVSMLTWYLSPTPQGLGTFELVASTSLAHQGVPASAALAVPLTFRAFIQVLPVMVGLTSYSLRRWRHSAPAAKPTN